MGGEENITWVAGPVVVGEGLVSRGEIFGKEGSNKEHEQRRVKKKTLDWMGSARRPELQGQVKGKARSSLSYKKGARLRHREDKRLIERVVTILHSLPRNQTFDLRDKAPISLLPG